MIQNIPYSFNKMAVYRSSGGSTPPEPPSPIPTANLIWYMDFSNGYLQPHSQINGTTSYPEYYSIQTDPQLGSYLSCNVNSTSIPKPLQWEGSQTYLNNLLASNGLDPFTISFWLRAPQWSNNVNESVISWKNSDNSTGMAFYRDGTGGGNANKICCRSEKCYWFFTATNASYNSQWNHWAFVRDSNGGGWYCNGVLDNDVPDSRNPQLIQNTNIRAVTNLRIGHVYWNNCTARFDVTKYRIYLRALTSSEINALYTYKA